MSLKIYMKSGNYRKSGLVSNKKVFGGQWQQPDFSQTLKK